MVKFLKSNIILGIILLFVSCATSMTPIEVNNTLPPLTKSKFLTQSQAEESIKSNNCKYIIKGRKYTAPVGLTSKDDLKNGAKGIDEWVELDRGNSYVLINYNWVIVDHNGTTQLNVEFDTLLCE